MSRARLLTVIRAVVAVVTLVTVVYAVVRDWGDVAVQLGQVSWATFAWLMPAAIRASSRNMSTNWSSSTRCGWMRLIATHFWKPPGPSMRARWTLAMPPMPISSTTR